MPRDKFKRAISVALSLSMLISAPQLGNAADLVPNNGMISSTPSPCQTVIAPSDAAVGFSMKSFEAKISKALKPSNNVKTEKVKRKTSSTVTNAIDIKPNNFDYKNADVSFSKSGPSMQGIINIKNCNASKTFDFKIKLKPGEKLVTSRELLGEEFDTGEVFVINSDNMITKIIDKPWAIDKNNISLPTYFNTSENVLTQFVEHSCSDSFPILADPNAWDVTICVGAISLVIAGIAIPAAKILKIKKAIKIAGGLKIFAELLIGLIMGTGDVATQIEALGPIVKDAFSILLGIDGIINKCKFD